MVSAIVPTRNSSLSEACTGSASSVPCSVSVSASVSLCAGALSSGLLPHAASPAAIVKDKINTNNFLRFMFFLLWLICLL